MPTRVQTVPVVTAEHGRRFAETYMREPIEAWSDSGVFTWPEDKPSQLRVHELEDEIEAKMEPEVREFIAAAFVKAANEVLNAEREARPTPPQPRLAFYQLFTVEGQAVCINPWQIVAMEDILVPNSGLGTRVFLANGSAYDLPIPSGGLYSMFLAAANGEDAER